MKSYTNITEGNALRIDWNDVIPKENLNYIMGNPPFVGSKYSSEMQKSDMDYVFENNQSALSYLRDRYPIKTERELRTILGRLQFKGEDVYKDVTKMSNGEKMRLILCSFSVSGYELLVLDEPTNHLDLITKECLIESLKNYEGAIIFVSHDRYFINE